MPHPPTVPRRLSAVLAAVVLAVLALTATTVQAKPKAAPKVVGESTTFTLAPAVRDRIAALNIALGVVAPATRSGLGSVTFPITKVRGPVHRLRGVVRHAGGLTLTRGERTVIAAPRRDRRQRPSWLRDREGRAAPRARVPADGAETLGRGQQGLADGRPAPDRPGREVAEPTPTGCGPPARSAARVGDDHRHARLLLAVHRPARLTPAPARLPVRQAGGAGLLASGHVQPALRRGP